MILIFINYIDFLIIYNYKYIIQYPGKGGVAGVYHLRAAETIPLCKENDNVALQKILMKSDSAD